MRASNDIYGTPFIFPSGKFVRFPCQTSHQISFKVRFLEGDEDCHLQAPCSRPRALLAVLRDTVAKRPIFFLDFDQINEDIFRTNAKYRMELVGDLLV